MNNCDLIDCQGRCRKWGSPLRKCKESSAEWFDDELSVCEVDEVCRKASIFGNALFRITREQLAELEHGKVLYAIDEYGTFILLEGEDNGQNQSE